MRDTSDPPRDGAVGWGRAVPGSQIALNRKLHPKIC
jgi:hypothetical protein